MSHFLVLCVLGPERSEIALDGCDVMSLISDVLAPYSEHLEVEPYKELCYCRTMEINRRRDEAMIKELGVGYNEFFKKAELDHTEWRQKNGIKLDPLARCDKSEAHWAELLLPMQAIEDRVKTAASAEDPSVATRKDCDECGGSGMRTSTYNPKSKWDWYQIGGRWTGCIDPTGYDPRTDSRNISSCKHCGGSGKRLLTESIPMAWIKAEAMRNPFIYEELDIPVEGGAKGSDEDRERAKLIVDSHAAYKSGTLSISDYIKKVFPAFACRLRSDDPDHITCWFCGGDGTRLAWPTEFALHRGDIQPASTYKKLLASDPSKFVPYALCVESAGPDASRWYEQGSMGWFGSHSPHQSFEGWQSDVADIFSAIPDDAAVVVVDCHI